MALTRNFKETVIQRVQNDSSFAQALLEAAGMPADKAEAVQKSKPQLSASLPPAWGPLRR